MTAITDFPSLDAVRRRIAMQRRFWNPVYDHFACAYDAVDWFTANYTHTLRLHMLRFLPPPPARLLEVGIGTGRLHTLLAGRYDMAGLDLAPGMIRRTRRRLAQAGRRSDLAVASVYAIPWPANSFDAVFSTFAFSAFANADSALGEMVRVTKPGGSVIIVDAGDALDGNRMAHLLARIWEAMGDFMRDEAPWMKANGLAVHMSLVAAVEWCAERVPVGGAVVVGVERLGDRGAVRITGEAADGTAVAVSGAGCDAGFGGGLEVSPEPAAGGILLVAPVGRV